MTFFALIAVLSILLFVVSGVALHMFMYSNGALDGGKTRRSTNVRLSAASLSQIATISTPIAAENLYYGEAMTRISGSGMSLRKRRLILYSVALLVTLAMLIVLVMGATQF